MIGLDSARQWLSSKFSSVEDKPDRSALIEEVATRVAAGGLDLGGWLGMLPDPDPILRKRGEGAEVLEELTADDQVCTSIQTRKLKTLNKRDYRFRPGAADGQDPTPEATRLCEALVKDLERIDLYNLISQVLDAPYHGLTVAELLWQPDGGRLKLADIVPKPRAWFGFDDKNQLIFRGDGLTGGDPLPFGKFVLARHFPTFQNPYGLRLLSRCLWQVAFKRGGVQFWMNFAEKFGTPWIVGKAAKGAGPADRATMLNALSSMVQSAVAVISGGGDVEVHESSGTAGDIHQKLYHTWDTAIARVLMGQTLTSSDGQGKGSYALGKTHYAVLNDYAEADETLVKTFFEDLAWTYGQVNAGADVLTPTFAFVEPEDRLARANLDTRLHRLGVRFKKEHFVDAYGLAKDAFEIAPPSGAGAAGGGSLTPKPTAEPKFSEYAGDDPDLARAEETQRVIDGLADAVLPQAEQAISDVAAGVATTLARAESYEDAHLLLAEALAPDADAYEDLLQQSIFAAEMYGRWAVGDEKGEFSEFAEVEAKALPMKEALAYWQSKVPVSSEEFSKLSKQARDRAFTVAGVARQDLLQDVHASLASALAEGKSLGAWRKETAGVLADAGITQRWRQDTIFRSNVQSAYMAGRYAQMQRVAKARPYWRYVAVADKRTRPEHRALHGMVYPHDHEFWSNYYPPNGFRCRCTVQSLSAREVEARGLQVEKDLPGLVEPIDPVTGERMLPIRPVPDQGWSGNVGKDWLSGLTPESLEENISALAAKALCREGKGLFSDERCKPPLATLDPRHIHVVGPKDILPSTLSKEDQVLAFLKEFGMGGIDDAKVITLPGNYPLAVNKWLFMDKATGKFKGAWADKGPYMRLLGRTILNPFEAWWQPVEVGPHKRLLYQIRLLRLFADESGKGIGGYTSFSLLGGREWQGATAFAPKADRGRERMLEYLEKMRGGVLLHREELKKTGP